MHTCPYPNCKTPVSVSQLACRPHWFQLPKPLREDVWFAWRRKLARDPDGDAAHRRALAAAVDWWQQKAVAP